MKRYLIVIAAIYGVAVAIPLLQAPATATPYGLALVVADYVGKATAIVVLGMIGLLYRRDPYNGFLAGVTIAGIGVILGGMQP